MTIEHFQNLVIGSGVAGKILAWTLASQGQTSVERTLQQEVGRPRGLDDPQAPAIDRLCPGQPGRAATIVSCGNFAAT